MFGLNEFFSGDVSLDDFVDGPHFDALTQDFCSDYDIYAAEKNNFDIPCGPSSVDPSEIGSEETIFDAEVLLNTLKEEDGPSLSTEFDSIVEVQTTEIEAAPDIHPKFESADVTAEAVEMRNSDESCLGRAPGVPLSGTRIPAFRTVPAMSKVELLVILIANALYKC